MNVAIVGGTGKLGQGLALRMAAAGHRVWLGSREFERAEKTVHALAAMLAERALPGDRLRPADNTRATTEGEVVVLATPASGGDAVLEAIAPSLDGKVLVDCRVDMKGVAEPGFPGTAVRLNDRLANRARVVAGFHTVAAAKLADLTAAIEGDTLIVGDDASAKELVIGLARSIDLRAFDAGSLRWGATLERLTAMVIGMNRRYRRRAIGIRLTGIGRIDAGA